MQTVDLHDAYVAVSTSGVALVSVSGTAPNHLSKYKPLQIVKSPRNCGISHSQGMFPFNFMSN